MAIQIPETEPVEAETGAESDPVSDGAEPNSSRSRWLKKRYVSLALLIGIVLALQIWILF